MRRLFDAAHAKPDMYRIIVCMFVVFDIMAGLMNLTILVRNTTALG